MKRIVILIDGTWNDEVVEHARKRACGAAPHPGHALPCRADPGFNFQTANSKRAFAFPRHDMPELCTNEPPNKGRGATPRGERGMPGARCTLAACAKCSKHTR
jgi:hypothetical protein